MQHFSLDCRFSLSQLCAPVIQQNQRGGTCLYLVLNIANHLSVEGGLHYLIGADFLIMGSKCL